MSNTTGRNPSSIRGSTNALICPAFPPQPCTSITAGPSPQVCPTRRSRPTMTWNDWPRSSTACWSGAGCVRGGLKKSRRPGADPAASETALVTWKPARTQDGTGYGRGRTVVLFVGSERTAESAFIEGLLFSAAGTGQEAGEGVL